MLARMALLTVDDRGGAAVAPRAAPSRVTSSPRRWWSRPFQSLLSQGALLSPRPRPAPRSARDDASLARTTERATERIARLLAADARGRRHLSPRRRRHGQERLQCAYVRAVARDPDLEVPSPTYLLQQVYDTHDPSFGPPVHHFDLYRLAGPSEMSKLGLDDSFANAASLLEWAERLGDLAPEERLDVFVRAGDDDEAFTTVRADADEDEDEDEDDDVDPAFLDLRGRLVRLVPRGETWRERIDALAGPAHSLHRASASFRGVSSSSRVGRPSSVIASSLSHALVSFHRLEHGFDLLVGETLQFAEILRPPIVVVVPVAREVHVRRRRRRRHRRRVPRARPFTLVATLVSVIVRAPLGGATTSSNARSSSARIFAAKARMSDACIGPRVSVSASEPSNAPACTAAPSATTSSGSTSPGGFWPERVFHEPSHRRRLRRAAHQQDLIERAPGVFPAAARRRSGVRARVAPRGAPRGVHHRARRRTPPAESESHRWFDRNRHPEMRVRRAVASTSTVPPPTSRMDTSNVPPPRSKTNTVSSPSTSDAVRGAPSTWHRDDFDFLRARASAAHRVASH